MSLETNLNRLRTRLVLRTFLRALATSLSAGLLLAGTMLLLSSWLGWELGPLLTLLVSLGASLVAAATATLVTDTSLFRTARLLESADSLLHARLSTALELKRSGQTDSILRRAQLADAEAHAARLVPRERIPLLLPRALQAAMLSGAAVLSTAMIVTSLPGGPAPTPPSLQATAGEELSESEQETLSVNLQQLADLFADADEAGTDSYLQAISRQMQELGERLEEGDLSREQLSSELERLLQHTRTALDLQDTPQQRLEQLPQMLEAALRDLNQQELAQQELPPGMDQTGDELAAGADQPLQETGDAAAADQPPSLSEMLEAGDQMETGDGASQSASGDSPRHSGSYFDAVIDEQTIAELNARAMDAAANQSGGEAIGASPESQEGASSMAGEGTDELFGSELAANLNAERLEQMAVPEETDPDGRHVRIEVTPEAQLTEVRMTPLGQISWDRQLETGVEREAIATDQRLVSARYHTPEQAE